MVRIRLRLRALSVISSSGCSVASVGAKASPICAATTSTISGPRTSQSRARVGLARSIPRIVAGTRLKASLAWFDVEDREPPTAPLRSCSWWPCSSARCASPRRRPAPVAGCRLFPAEQLLARRRVRSPRPSAVGRLGRRHRPGRRAEGGLRLGDVGGPPHRHPHQRRHQRHADLPGPVRLLGRERPGPLPDPGPAPHRGRRRPPPADGQPGHVHAARALRGPQANGRWYAGSGAVWNLRSNALRPAGWTSADAAGLPILPGLVRWPRSPPATSTTPSASPPPTPRTATSGPLVTRRATAAPTCRPWGPGSG